MPTPIDYRELLIKYIEYIGEMEGTDYLGYEKHHPIFSKSEWDVLRELAKEGIESCQH